ncbi:MAG: bifunctional histidinol-phosphatase/imidazoleglycerol-phosphate dehydratase HisB [Bacteroidales bacterium]|nr:bifunctional histidinol-phosphatase/imidazoleglycerol-phosphate dehydratase HisB [Bacteroidales bacterium]
MKKKVLFIDRDGTLIHEPSDFQIDSYEKLRFLPGVIRALHAIRQKTDYELVLVSNQDGLGTPSFPEETFWPAHNLMLQILKDEGITFDASFIDRSFEHENKPTRKPGTAMLTHYMTEGYDLANSYVIGDRLTDLALAKNLGAKGLQIGKYMTWDKIATIIIAGGRQAQIHRQTKETDIVVSLNLDGTGQSTIDTGIPFFDHMLDQIAHHSLIDLNIKVNGDLHIDEHHTIEDTAISLGQCLREAIGNKLGIERYGYSLPMDDCQCQLSLDFGGRPWLVWEANFYREMIGGMPTEMFLHFFKSLSDSALMNLNIRAEGQNEHHKIESIFKAFARALKMAIRRDINHLQLPSSKGQL